MKYYGVNKKIIYENIMYTTIRFRKFITQYTSTKKEIRDFRKSQYADNFINPSDLDTRDLSIPSDKYYIPIYIITSDLILREDIPKLKVGLKRLIKNQYSHKFLGRCQSIDDICFAIDNMDSTLRSSYRSIDIDSLDFENNVSLKHTISWFSIKVRNINTSYLSIEFYICLSDTFRQELCHIINNTYRNLKGHIFRFVARSRSASGSKHEYGIRFYNAAFLKSDKINEQITLLKWEFYNEIQKYFHTLLHQKGSIPPGINIYKTNIHYSNKTAYDFWESVGILKGYGQKIDEANKLFFTVQLSGRYDNNFPTDLVYITNDQILNQKPWYSTTDLQILYDFTDKLCSRTFDFVFLDLMNDLISKKVVLYKSKLNEIKLRRDKLSKLLKLRYQSEKDLDFYIRFISEKPWNDIQDDYSSFFQNSKYSYGYIKLIKSTVYGMDVIKKQIDHLFEEFDKKTTLLQHLSAYKNEGKSRRRSLLMLIVASVTLILIIFPELSSIIAELIKSFVKSLLSLPFK